MTAAALVKLLKDHDLLAASASGVKPLQTEVLVQACIDISLVTQDSRRAEAGALYVAVEGEHQDGHDFIEDAVARGAVAVLGQRAEPDSAWAVPYLCVNNARRAVGVVAHHLAGNPSAKMIVIGITGTNGKSSTVLMTQAILEAAGHPTATVGTLGYDVGEGLVTTAHTTPFGEDLAGVFAAALAAGRTHLVMEVSSHALEQERVAGINFRGVAFTNLTQDHLDYHGDMDTYCEVKLGLFARTVGADRYAVVNGDDPVANRFTEAAQGPCYAFGSGGDCRAENVHMDFGGTRFVLCSPWGSTAISMHLLGHHNVSNALCAAALCGALGVPLKAIGQGLDNLASVPGRFEALNMGQDYYVVVDYAHTDDGLLNVLTAARALCRGRLIVVFGCGGDRDRNKRPKMGAVAARLSDFAILTSDNPRTEDPVRILEDVEAGMGEGRKGEDGDYVVMESREAAIQRGIAMAETGDFVLIAGKGHEDYQILGTERIHFDDREVARAVMENK
jgi:UDP-N-acetylmuramoyl-L-alanyl-D-glutamate--2,6-diaminopimelate ligase